MRNNFKDKKGAIEMSMTTIVTIVLVVVTLVLALVLIRSIFSSSTNAIEQVDTAIQDQINKLFASEGTDFVIYPASRDIDIKKGDDPRGFAFSVENSGTETAEFSYTVTATDVSSCGASFTKQTADAYLLGGTGQFSLGAGSKLGLSRLVRFNIPDNAIACTIIYTLTVNSEVSGFPQSADIFVTIK